MGDKLIIEDKEAISKKDDQYIHKHIPLLKKIKGSVKAMNAYRILFNDLCGHCKAKVIKNPQTKLEDYCDRCRGKTQRRLEAIRGMFK